MEQPFPQRSVPDVSPAQTSAGAALDEARRYRLILDSLADMVFCKSPALQVTFANRATQRYYGATEEQLRGITDVPYNKHDFTQQYLRDDRAVFETKRPVIRAEEPNVAPDGTVRWFETVKSPIFDEAGNVTELVGVSRDITDLRRERADAQRSRAHLELALEAGRMGTWEWDIAGQTVIWSAQEERLYGLEPGTFDGSVDSYVARIHPEDRAASWAAVERALAAHSETHHVLHRIVRPNGEVRWLDSHGRFLYDDDGRPLRLVGISADVTERHLAQESLREHAESTEAARMDLLRLFDQTPAMISVTEGPDQVITYQNARSRAATGGRDLVGQRARDIFPEEDIKQLLAIVDRVRDTGEPFIGLEVPVRVDLEGTGAPTERFFNLVYQPLRNADGAIYGIMSFSVEVTEQVRARKAVEAQAQTLAVMTRALQATNRDLDQFAYVASHDLKAPLRGIANLAQWIEEDLGDAVPAESRKHLELLKGRVHRMEALIDGVLAYSRAGRTADRPERVDSGALLREVLDLLGVPAAAQVEIPPDMPELTTERVPLQQVFLNLVGNALKHSRRDDPVVRVSHRRAPGASDYVEFTVADNGQGIAPEFQERVWGIFQTLEARDQVEGTGIGLAVVKKLVEVRGGTVSVESALGRGARFRFTWPRSADASRRTPPPTP